jgi:hypothetical protein
MTKIALVGHCGVDGPRIEARIHDILDDAQVCSCNDAESLDRVCGDGVDLLLFNRELGYGFDDGQGVELIKQVHKSHPDIKLMLISDRPEAQRKAEKAGAMPGFGKADLTTSKVEKALRNALG